jgi:hypothetical protein
MRRKEYRNMVGVENVLCRRRRERMYSKKIIPIDRVYYLLFDSIKVSCRLEYLSFDSNVI